MNWVEDIADGAVLRVRVIPRAREDRVVGLVGNRLKVRLQAPPVSGKANKALLKLLARQLALPARNLTLVSGATARDKGVRVAGSTAADVKLALQELLSGPS